MVLKTRSRRNRAETRTGADNAEDQALLANTPTQITQNPNTKLNLYCIAKSKQQEALTSKQMQKKESSCVLNQTHQEKKLGGNCTRIPCERESGNSLLSLRPDDNIYAALFQDCVLFIDYVA